jgi:hypothetical protein
MGLSHREHFQHSALAWASNASLVAVLGAIGIFPTPRLVSSPRQIRLAVDREPDLAVFGLQVFHRLPDLLLRQSAIAEMVPQLHG